MGRKKREGRGIQLLAYYCMEFLGPRQIHLTLDRLRTLGSWFGEGGHTNMSILYTHTYIHIWQVPPQGGLQPGAFPL